MILADENVPESVVIAVESAGFQVVRMRDLRAGAPDTEVLALARARGLMVLPR